MSLTPGDRDAEPLRPGPGPTADGLETVDLTEVDDTEAAGLGLRIEELHTAKVSDLDPTKVAKLRLLFLVSDGEVRSARGSIHS